MIAMAADALSAPGFAPLAGEPLVLPEPPASREDVVDGGALGAWLAETAAGEGDGYALLSSARQTVVVLYGSGQPVAAARTRGGEARGARALEEALTAGGEWLAVSHPLRPEQARCLSGLFFAPRWSGQLRDKGGSLESLFADLRRERFTGAVRLTLDDAFWATALVADGVPLASFGGDDRALKGDLADVATLAAFDDLRVVCHPAGRDDLAQTLERHLRVWPSEQLTDGRDAMIVESLLIEAFSIVEHRIAVAEQGAATHESLALALADAYRLLTDAQLVIGRPSAEAAPEDPIVAPFWNESQRQLDTARMLATFQRVGVANVWWVAAVALTNAIEERVTGQLVWLTESDAASAQLLADAARDIFARARERIGR